MKRLGHSSKGKSWVKILKVSLARDRTTLAAVSGMLAEYERCPEGDRL